MTGSWLPQVGLGPSVPGSAGESHHRAGRLSLWSGPIDFFCLQNYPSKNINSSLKTQKKPTGVSFSGAVTNVGLQRVRQDPATETHDGERSFCWRDRRRPTAQSCACRPGVEATSWRCPSAAGTRASTSPGDPRFHLSPQEAGGVVIPGLWPAPLF